MLALLFALCAPSAMAETLSDYPCRTEIPLIRQGTTYTCGIAALHSILRWASYDLDINDETLMEACGTTVENGTAWGHIIEYMLGTHLLDAEWRLNMTCEELRQILDAEGVVMMPIQAWEYKEIASNEWVSFDAEDYRDYWMGGHWVIACGYNENNVLFMDPATAGCYTAMTWDALEIRWHDSPDSGDGAAQFVKYEHAGIVVYKLSDELYDKNSVYPLD